MAKRQTYLMNRNGHYYFRYVISSSIQHRFGCKEFTHSLKTKDYHQAKAKIGILLLMAETVIKTVREESLDMSAGKKYDMILMDLLMPVMDGIAATQCIRARGGSHDRKVPIIALTGNIVPEEKVKCFKAGMNDFLSKPVTPEDFIGALQKHAGQKPAQPAKAALALVDLNVLAQFGDNAAKVVELTIRDAEAFIMNSVEALKKGDAEGVGEEAHALKSLFAQVGAADLARLALTLEVKGRKGEMEGAGEIIAEMLSGFEAVKKILLASLHGESGQ